MNSAKKELLAHSKAKVRLLGEYLKRYLNIICNDGHTKRIKIYDLFCGEGLYENGGEGSPFIIVRQIRDIHSINIAKLSNIPKIDCYFNDKDISKVEKLRTVLADKQLHDPKFGELEYTTNDYQIRYENLLTELLKLKEQKQKAFIFIDPYEYKHIKADQIRCLISQGNSEVLLWLPTQFMYRFASNGTPEVLKDFIIEIIPSFGEWKPENIWDFIAQLKEGFQRYLGDNFFVDTFTIEKDTNSVFCLFFFTSHIKGFEKMLEAKWEIDTEHGKGWNYKGNEPSLFFKQKTNDLEERLYEFLAKENRYNNDIYEFTLRQGYLPKHATEILKYWQKENKIEVLLKNGEKPRKGAFYIKYLKTTDSDFKKVYFRIL